MRGGAASSADPPHPKESVQLATVAPLLRQHVAEEERRFLDTTLILVKRGDPRACVFKNAADIKAGRDAILRGAARAPAPTMRGRMQRDGVR